MKTKAQDFIVIEVLFHVNLHVELICASPQHLFLGICCFTERLQIRYLHEGLLKDPYNKDHGWYSSYWWPFKVWNEWGRLDQFESGHLRPTLNYPINLKNDPIIMIGWSHDETDIIGWRLSCYIKWQITIRRYITINNLLNISVQVNMLVSLSSWGGNLIIIIGQRVINCVIAGS